MYYVVITPKRGPQYRTGYACNFLDDAIQCANVEAAANARLVAVEVYREDDGEYVRAWERNLWEERKSE